MQQKIDEIGAYAEKAFGEHVLTRKGPSEWYCGHPDGRGANSFTVAIAGGHIMVAGDICDMLLSPRASGGRTLEWLLTASSPSYLLSKAPSCIVTSEWSRDLAEEAMREHFEDMAPELRTRLAVDDTGMEWDEDSDGQPELSVDSEEDWVDFWWSEGDEPPRCHDLTLNAAWTVHAIRCFRRLYSDTPAARTGEE